MKLTTTQHGNIYEVRAGEIGIGTLSCQADAVITNLSVEPSHRNRGLGSKILRRLEYLAKTQGYEEVVGQFSGSNPFAQETATEFLGANGYTEPQISVTNYAYDRADFPWKQPESTLPHGMEIVPISQMQPQELDTLLAAFGEKISPYIYHLDSVISLTLWEQGIPLGYVLAAKEGDTLVVLGLGCGDTATGGSFYLLQTLLANNPETTIQTQWEIPQVTPKCREKIYQCWKVIP